MRAEQYFTPPAQRGEGTRRSLVRGAGSASTLATGLDPSTAVPTVPLPRFAGEVEVSIEGYASLWWCRDLNDDVVAKGAFDASLIKTPAARVRMLMQHDVKEVVGVWDSLTPDASGLFVRGRILVATPAGRMAQALVKAGALDGLSIGFRAVKARADGRLRILTEVELWEVSLVTFPMLPGARLRVVKEVVPTTRMSAMTTRAL